MREIILNGQYMLSEKYFICQVSEQICFEYEGGAQEFERILCEIRRPTRLIFNDFSDFCRHNAELSEEIRRAMENATRQNPQLTVLFVEYGMRRAAEGERAVEF